MSLDTLSNAAIHVFILLKPLDLYNVRTTNKKLKHAIDSISKTILENKWASAVIKLNIIPNDKTKSIAWYKLLRFMYLHIETLPTICKYLRKCVIDHEIVLRAGNFKLNDGHLDSKIIGSGIDTCIHVEVKNPTYSKLSIHNASIDNFAMENNSIDTIEIINCKFTSKIRTSISCQHAIITKCVFTSQILLARVDETLVFNHNILVDAEHTTILW